MSIDHTMSTPGWQRTGRTRGPASFVARHRARRAQRDYEASVAVFADALKGEFREACTGLSLCQYVQVAAGVTVRTPRVGEVRIGPPMSFTVELLPGQEGADFTRKENGPRLAHSLGGHGLRVEPVAVAGSGSSCSTTTRCVTATACPRSPSTAAPTPS